MTIIEGGLQPAAGEFFERVPCPNGCDLLDPTAYANGTLVECEVCLDRHRVVTGRSRSEATARWHRVSISVQDYVAQERSYRLRVVALSGAVAVVVIAAWLLLDTVQLLQPLPVWRIFAVLLIGAGAAAAAKRISRQLQRPAVVDVRQVIEVVGGFPAIAGGLLAAGPIQWSSVPAAVRAERVARLVL